MINLSFADWACTGQAFLIRMRCPKTQVEVVIDTVRTAFRNFRSICALGIVSLFVLFLTASAPHRVHHFFEQPQFPVAHGHTDDAADAAHSHGPDHDLPKSQHSDCAIQSVAQNSHISSAQLIEVPFLEIALAHKPDPGIVASAFFDASPFSQRAPPAA
jgi:hypothetical protein